MNLFFHDQQHHLKFTKKPDDLIPRKPPDRRRETRKDPIKYRTRPATNRVPLNRYSKEKTEIMYKS